MNTGFNKNQTEFSIHIFAVAFQMLADSNSFLDQLIKIFWDFWAQTVGFEDAKNLVTSDSLDLVNTLRISFG